MDATQRENEYAAFIGSFESDQIADFLHARLTERTTGRTESLELFVHDMFMEGKFQTEDVGAYILAARL